MATMIVRLQVEEYETWKREFDGVEGSRQEHGWIKHEVYRDIQDPNGVVIINHVLTLEQGKAYFDADAVKEAVGRSGIQGAPVSWILNEEEAKEY